jgi:hypothetical protein
MATHTLHADLLEAGLADGCKRCEQLADDPFGLLDDANLGKLIDRVEAGDDARSDNERRVMNTIYVYMERMRRLAHA